jgi:hypothetical protein
MPPMDDLKRWLPMLAVGVGGMLLYAWGPIAQPAGYHAFADRRILGGVANGGDVLSNAAFSLAGLWGLWRLRRAGSDVRRESVALWLFAAILVLVAAGSAYYHLAPTNARLVWDRLPIALACGALLAAAYIRTHDTDLTLTLPLGMVAFGAATVLWWWFTESRGRGDLRIYVMLQAAPLVLVPLWQWIARSPERERAWFGVAVLLYVLAKVAELQDRAIYEALGFVSGHTLKHLLAAAASACIVASFTTRRPPGVATA